MQEQAWCLVIHFVCCMSLKQHESEVDTRQFSFFGENQLNFILVHRLSYLNNVQHNVLVKAIQDALGNAVVIPSTVNQQKILQVLEL